MTWIFLFSDDETPGSREPRSKTLKYEYKEDQWSPLNPEGKKQYDREFLICLQNDPLSLQKPTNLPPMEIVKVSLLLRIMSHGDAELPPFCQFRVFPFWRSVG